MNMTRFALKQLDDDYKGNTEKSMLIELFWMALRSMLELHGSLDTLEEIRPHMRNGGHAFALNMINKFGIEGTDIERIDEVTWLAEAVTEMTTEEVGHTSDRIIRSGGTMCPWNGGPQESCIVCHEMFFQGICEQINPEYKCRFTQMIPLGDPVCSYVIEKKKKG
jgi:predicted hydrocarbon binding protein